MEQTVNWLLFLFRTEKHNVITKEPKKALRRITDCKKVKENHHNDKYTFYRNKNKPKKSLIPPSFAFSGHGDHEGHDHGDHDHGHDHDDFWK